MLSIVHLISPEEAFKTSTINFVKAHPEPFEIINELIQQASQAGQYAITVKHADLQLATVADSNAFVTILTNYGYQVTWNQSTYFNDDYKGEPTTLTIAWKELHESEE